MQWDTPHANEGCFDGCKERVVEKDYQGLTFVLIICIDGSRANFSAFEVYLK
jgi:hypothetical protein